MSHVHPPRLPGGQRSEPYRRRLRAGGSAAAVDRESQGPTGQDHSQRYIKQGHMTTGHRLFCKEFLCFNMIYPVVICPYLCTSDTPSQTFSKARRPTGDRIGAANAEGVKRGRRRRDGGGRGRRRRSLIVLLHLYVTPVMCVCACAMCTVMYFVCVKTDTPASCTRIRTRAYPHTSHSCTCTPLHA